MGELGDYWRDARENRRRHRMFNTVECEGCGLYANGNAVKVSYGSRCHRCGWEAPEIAPKYDFTEEDYKLDTPKDFACPICEKKFHTQHAVEDHIRSKRSNGHAPHRDYLRKLRGEAPSYRISGEDDDDTDFIPF